MITAERVSGTNEAAKWKFTGISDDDKPTVEWEGTKILNSSSFLRWTPLRSAFTTERQTHGSQRRDKKCHFQIWN